MSSQTQFDRAGIVFTNVFDDSVSKITFLDSLHYDVDEENVSLIKNNITSTQNQLIIGGSDTGKNALTEIDFYTADDTTTLTGTKRGRIDKDGKWLIGNGNPAGEVRLQVLGTDMASIPAPIMTEAQMQALTPLDGMQVYLTDNWLKTIFTYNAQISEWTAPGFRYLDNDAGSTLGVGTVVVQGPNDFSVDDTDANNNIEVLGVVAIGGTQAEKMLVKVAGEIDVMKVAGTINRGDFVQSSTTFFKCKGTAGGSIGTFGIALETSTGDTIRIMIRGFENI